jgi:putative transposase
MRVEQAKRLRELEKENARLKKLVADISLDNAILKEAARGNWSYDFVVARTAEGRRFKLLTIIDEYTRECLSIVVERRITSQDVIGHLFDLLVLRGIPEHIRSDNGPEFMAREVRRWLSRLGVKTLFIEPGSPWENGYIESFNDKLRDELLNREIFTTLTEAKVLIAQWRQEYNHVRPHSSLHYRPPAPEAQMIATLTLSYRPVTLARITPGTADLLPAQRDYLVMPVLPPEAQSQSRSPNAHE